jgi:hypothetical protein
VLAAIEISVKDLHQQMQGVVGTLAIASRSLTRELAGDAGPGRPQQPEPAAAVDDLQLAPG